MTDGLWGDFLSALDEDEFEEYPVGVDEWIEGEDYLNRPEIHLSEDQREAMLNMTQIYKRESLSKFLTDEEAEIRFKQSKSEICLQWGKGSGKDLISELACTYIVYQLLCLKDPAKYYGKPSDDSIDILNVAINSTQAYNVFFSGFKRYVTKSPWFQGKYRTKDNGGEPASKNEINFSKNVNVYSGHSEREGWEGYNLIACFLDEISGFAEAVTAGNEGSKTADAIYKMYSASVTSRFEFPYGKLAMLSFPRYKGDFIQKAYDSMVANKQVIQKSHTFKIDNDLPDGVEGNEFDIDWEEEVVHAYTSPEYYAVKAPSWVVNPTKTLEGYKTQFFKDRTDALSRFAAMPPDAVDAFFKDRAKVEAAFVGKNGVDNTTGQFSMSFVPRLDTTYYVHVDLARKHDRCAVAMAHVSGWSQKRFGSGQRAQLQEASPSVTVDALRYWTPTRNNEVDFAEVRDYITSLAARGFDIQCVSFDQWESDDMMRYLKNYGLHTEKLSIKKPHYQNMLGILMDDRLLAPEDETAVTELLQLRQLKGDKIDHPSNGHNDIADALCGAISQATAKTPLTHTDTIEVKSIRTVVQENRNSVPPKKNDGVIRAPKKSMPTELQDYLSSLRVI